MSKTYIALDERSIIASGTENEYVVFTGATYSINQLREWAWDRYGTELHAPLEVIAEAVKQGGWILFESITAID